MTTQLDVAAARRVLEVVDAGLCNGVGRPEPGHMCVEAAVCYALGEPHGDRPTCVGSAVRAFKISLNDAAWSSNEARAKGLRDIAVAQLGSKETDQVEFARIVALETVRQILPPALRAIGLEAEAVACETAVDLSAAESAASASKSAAWVASAAAWAASASAWAAAESAAESASAWASKSAEWAAASASAASAASAEWAAASASAAASAAAWAASASAKSAAKSAAELARESVLIAAAKIGVSALRQVGCLGVQLLDAIHNTPEAAA